MNNHQNLFEDNFSSNYNRSTSTNPNSRFSDCPPDQQQIQSRSDEKNFSSTFNSQVKEWTYRNGRNGVIRSSYLHEDSILFKEHVDQMEKKQTFDFSNLKSVDLKVVFRGKDVVDTNEMKTFNDFPDLNKTLSENLTKMKFDQMTPIQKAVMPYIIKGNDVMGCSQTGSGKTIAFLLPIITKMLYDGPPAEENDDGIARPVALILIPTRELADQIYKEARKLVHKTGITVVKVYGGVGQYNQVRDLNYGCDILVATPGRLIDFIKSRKLSLSMVKYLIIDEADRLLDMGFEPQLNNIVFDYDLRSKDKRLNLMFSATLEDDVKTIARKFMNEYYFIHTNTEMKASQNVTQMIVFAKEEEKIIQLHQFLQKIKGSIIIFLDTKRGVENLSHFLEKSNYNVIAIHGDKKQFQRQEAIQKFTTGEVPILIATDVASRGLDFPKVSYVFNYDMPSNIDAYIHRIGRTGRGGDKGVAVSFINDNNRNIVKSLHHVLRNQNQEIPDWFDRMYKNFASLSTYGKDNHSNYRNKSERDHTYLNRKRKEDFNYSRDPREQPVTNSNSGWGVQTEYNKVNDKPRGFNNGYSSLRPEQDNYSRYLTSNNFVQYPAINNTPNTNGSLYPNAPVSTNSNPITIPVSENKINTFPAFYQQPYNNMLPKFTYGNIGQYPDQNYNKSLGQIQPPTSQKPVELNNSFNKNNQLTPKFLDNKTDDNSINKRSDSINEIKLGQTEWIDLKDYSSSSKDRYSREKDKEKEKERERDRDRYRDRERDRDRYRDRERDRDRAYRRSSRDRSSKERSSRDRDEHRRSRHSSDRHR